jgi:hypothetical protein
MSDLIIKTRYFGEPSVRFPEIDRFCQKQTAILSPGTEKYEGLKLMNDKNTSSRLPGFYNLDFQERKKVIQKTGLLSDEEILTLFGEVGLKAEQADHMVENVI